MLRGQLLKNHTTVWQGDVITLVTCKLVISARQIITRRLAACTQAVVITRSTIAIELKCSAFEVVRNSIESMCLSYSAFDCISWNRLIAYYSFTGPLPRKMSQDRYVSLWTFQSIFFSLCRCCCLFVCFISQTRVLSYGGS